MRLIDEQESIGCFLYDTFGVKYHIGRTLGMTDTQRPYFHIRNATSSVTKTGTLGARSRRIWNLVYCPELSYDKDSQLDSMEMGGRLESLLLRKKYIPGSLFNYPYPKPIVRTITDTAVDLPRWVGIVLVGIRNNQETKPSEEVVVTTVAGQKIVMQVPIVPIANSEFDSVDIYARDSSSSMWKKQDDVSIENTNCRPIYTLDMYDANGDELSSDDSMVNYKPIKIDSVDVLPMENELEYDIGSISMDKGSNVFDCIINLWTNTGVLLEDDKESWTIQQVTHRRS